ncbi:hypothetical protein METBISCDRAFT_10563, partial [Metschnikowia bicuspidata]
NSGIRIVKEDDFSDDISNLGEDMDDGEMEGEEMELNGDMDELEGASEDLGDDFAGFESENEDSDPIVVLKALKGKKNGKSSLKLKIVKENELGDELSGDLSNDFSDALSNEKVTEKDVDDFGDSSDVGNSEFGDSNDFGEISGDEQEDPIAVLRKLKEAKKAQADKNAGRKSAKPAKVVEAAFVDLLDNDLEFYAKKLGLKDGKKSKLTKHDANDGIGGLLDGLDFDYLDESDGHSGTENTLFEGDSAEESDAPKKPKENPFAAPETDLGDASSTIEAESQPSKYILPALRKKLEMETGDKSAENLELQRAIIGPLNKLSESNLGAIVNELSGLYLNHPRQKVTENLTRILLETVVQQGRLLETFVLLRATLIVAIYRLQGVDCGAYFVQTLIEKYEGYKADASKTKEALNCASLLSSIFTFQLVSSKLLFDVIRELISDLTETNAELLLKIIRSSGNQMRTNDPAALKEIVILVTSQHSAGANGPASPRLQFLVETITSLKNNKLNAANDDSAQTTIRLKKFLGTAIAAKAVDPLQVTLDDIRSIETRGKWWLVGSSWKGQDTKNEPTVDIAAVNAVLDSAEPNWLELARAQRMNTDIRRAIFISIMSANDYVDALAKLDKLALKKVQEREIPRILVHCAVVEPAWNPYYGVLAAKLCDSHSYRKTFQFLLWDLVKSFGAGSGGYGDSDEEDGEEAFAGFDNSESEDEKLKKIMKLARLFGNLFAEGALALHVLRTVNFVAPSADLRLLLEMLFVSFFDQVAKKSQVHAVGVGLVEKSMSEQKLDEQTLINRLLKAKEEPALLRGISLFVQKWLGGSDFILGKKQRKRVEWGVLCAVDVIDEFFKE